MESVRCEIDGSQVSVGHFDPFGVFGFVQKSPHLKAGAGLRGGNQLDDCRVPRSGLPREFMVMNEKRWRSTLFTCWCLAVNGKPR